MAPSATPCGRAEIGMVRPAPGEVDAQAIDVWREGQLAGREAETYQGVPPVKKVPWEWYYIPVYFWIGGIAGGSGLAAAAEGLVGDDDRGVVRAGRYLSLGTVLAGTGLLVADLGRPERFLNMLRVFRARSPMSLGSWILTGFGSLSGAIALLQAAEDGLLGDRPWLARVSRGWPGRLLDVGVVPLALLVSSYTGVLLSATSTPTWARRARVLAPLFVASATSTGLAAVSAAVEATNGAAPGTRRRLARAEAAALAGELVLAAADRAVARSFPSARQEPAPIRLARWLTVGAGMVVPLAIQLAKSRPLVRGRPAGRRPARASVPARWSPRARLPKSDVGRHGASRSRSGLLAAGLTLAGGLALRLLVTYEGKRSADTPQDTWVFAGRDA